MDREYQLRPLTGMDYVHSMLLDNPDMFYVLPGLKAAVIFVPDRGFVIVQRDFSGMSNNQIYTFLFYLKRGIL